MRISSISMTMESRVNYGDYQGAMANLTVGAELGDETPEDGFKQLRAMLQQQLVFCIKSGSPNTMRTLLKGDAPGKDDDGDADASNGKATKAKATKAKPATKAKAKPKDELEDDDGPEEDAPGDDSLEDDDDGLGEEEPEEIDRPTVMAKLRELKAEKGAPAMQQVIKKSGAASFKEVPNEDLEKLYKLACKKLNE